MDKKNTLSLFLRSFLLQGFWNYALMQNVGFFYIVLPQLKRLYGADKAALQRAAARNLEAFNSQPVMSGYSIGALLKQEAIIKKTPPARLQEEEREWRIIRAASASTAASIGDRLFWATLKPLSLVLYLVILFAGGVDFLGAHAQDEGQVFFTAALALTGALLIYNAPAFVVRLKGLLDGYGGDEDNFYGLINLNWNKIIYFLKTLGQVLTIFVIFYGIYVHFSSVVIDAGVITRFSLLLAFTVLSIFMKRLNIPNIFLYITATLVFALAAILA
ncbi:MAG: PTS system mannose/fructose/sorbose family transporter subunit IID [Elusimicrobiota bacterium]|jgi:hypothetical protein|nr:PTS system mannose/fructose/sorbose family transporter subunit IID [Elusimicrobiota bacterium]